jgi:hypothetical protein
MHLRNPGGSPQVVPAKGKEIKMLGKILGGIAGARAARHSNKVGGVSGALMGAVAGSVLRRASLPALIALTAGGYAFKKYKERRDAAEAKRKSFETPPRPSAT